jgi:DsbC/DsbD-like thiol-disulfide interchange protein
VRAGLLAAAVAVSGAGISLAAPPQGPSHTRATLLSEMGSLQPARAAWIGLRLEMESQWRTHWLNPGDAGEPTRLRWTLPPGFEAGPIQWPAPQRIPTSPLVSYGYQGEVFLLVEVRTPADLKPGRTVQLRARVDWLECGDTCQPGRADLVLSLPVREETPAPTTSLASFADARRRLPQTARDVRVWAKASPEEWALSVSGPVGVREAYFFPAQAGVMDHAAPQELTTEGGGFRLSLRRRPGAAPQTLRGVLTFDGRVLLVDAPVTAAGP